MVGIKQCFHVISTALGAGWGLGDSFAIFFPVSKLCWSTGDMAVDPFHTLGFFSWCTGGFLVGGCSFCVCVFICDSLKF